MKFINLATTEIKEERLLHLSLLERNGDVEKLLEEIKEHGYTIEWQNRNYICVSKHTW